MSLCLPPGVVIPVEVEKFLASATDSILIDGERRPAASGETLESFDPGTGTVLTAIAPGAGSTSTGPFPLLRPPSRTSGGT